MGGTLLEGIVLFDIFEFVLGAGLDVLLLFYINSNALGFFYVVVGIEGVRLTLLFEDVCLFKLNPPDSTAGAWLFTFVLVFLNKPKALGY